jgi:hypothetical protein
MIRNHKTQFLAALLLAALLLPRPASAEPRAGGEQVPHEMRKEMLEKIRMVRMYSLTEALELDEATAARLFPYLRRDDSTLETLQQTKHKSHRALRAMVKSGDFEAKAADEHLAAISQTNIEIARTEAAQLKGLDRILSAEQRVKFVLAKVQFERRVREIMRDERHRKRRKRMERRQDGEPGMGGPGHGQRHRGG